MFFLIWKGARNRGGGGGAAVMLLRGQWAGQKVADQTDAGAWKGGKVWQLQRGRPWEETLTVPPPGLAVTGQLRALTIFVLGDSKTLWTQVSMGRNSRSPCGPVLGGVWL